MERRLPLVFGSPNVNSPLLSSVSVRAMLTLGPVFLEIGTPEETPTKGVPS